MISNLLPEPGDSFVVGSHVPGLNTAFSAARHRNLIKTPEVLGIDPINGAGEITGNRAFLIVHADQERPAICAANLPTHHLVGMYFKDQLEESKRPLSKQQQDSFYEKVVAGYIDLVGQLPLVKLRPDGDMNTVLLAYEILKAAGIPLSRIQFLTDGNVHDLTMKRLGLMHQRNERDILDYEGMQHYIKNSVQEFASGNRFYYKEARGERFLIPETFYQLERVISEPRQFKARLEEILNLVNTKSSTGRANNAQFLLVNENGSRNMNAIDMQKLKQEFYKLCHFVFSYPASRWEDDREPIVSRLRLFDSKFESMTSGDFLRSNFRNRHWVRSMYAMLSDVNPKKYYSSIEEKLETEGSPLPGGYIGYYSTDGTPRCGVESSSFAEVCRTYLLTGREKSRLENSEDVVLGPRRCGGDSTVVLHKSGTGNEDFIEQKKFIFHEGAQPQTKAALNRILIENHRLDYAYFVGFREIGSKLLIMRNHDQPETRSVVSG